MLIDTNSNVGHWPFQQTNCNTCKALVDRMDKYGVGVSAVSNMNGIFYKNTQSSNEELYQELLSERRFQNRFIPFAIINPIYAGWKSDIETCKLKMGFKGIRLYPLYHDYELTDPSCIELVKYARDLGMIVAFTIRVVDSRPRSWMDADKEMRLKDIIQLVREVPDVKYFILNVSSGFQLNNEEKVIVKNSELLFDTSGRNISNLGELLNTFGKEKFAFGTHSPILDYLTGLLRIESLRAGEADEQTKEMIRSGNAKRLLGI